MTNKLVFDMFDKELKDTFLKSLEDNNINILKKTITPFYKAWFKGTFYFSSFSDLVTARKIFKELKQLQEDNFKKEIQQKRQENNIN